MPNKEMTVNWNDSFRWTDVLVLCLITNTVLNFLSGLRLWDGHWPRAFLHRISIIDALASLSPKSHIKKGVSGSPYRLSLCETLMCEVQRLPLQRPGHIYDILWVLRALTYQGRWHLIVSPGRNIVKDLTAELGRLNGFCKLSVGTPSIMQEMTALPLFHTRQSLQAVLMMHACRFHLIKEW